MKMERTPRVEQRLDGTFYKPAKVSGMDFLRSWKKSNPQEYDGVLEEQEKQRAQAAEPAAVEEAEATKESLAQAPEQVYARGTDQSRNPLQPQVRGMHTSSRRMVTTTTETTPTTTSPSTGPVPYSKPKEWTALSRAERKDLVNSGTTHQLRTLRKERGKKEKLTKSEKRAVKWGIKIQLRQDLIGRGILEDQKMYDMMMTEEGRRRKREGLSKATPNEKHKFLREVVERAGKIDTRTPTEQTPGTAPGLLGRVFGSGKEKEKVKQ